MEISAKILAHSMSQQGKQIVTFELEYPRFIHSELMTHRMFAVNASSSRAIPIQKVIERVKTSPAMPIHWGKNKPGMSASEEIEDVEVGKQVWNEAAYRAIRVADAMDKDLNLHKQVVNRILEPYQWMKVVLTGTEFNNFFWLRIAEDAQPEICDLAKKMKAAIDKSEPTMLEPGEWHLPYIDFYRSDYGGILDYMDSVEGKILSLEEAKMISMARCAAVSYRTENIGIEKAQDIYKKLFSGQRVHASPAAHQATPMKGVFGLEQKLETMLSTDGITHMDTNGSLWSGNLNGWIQLRQLIPNNYVRG